MPKSDYAINRAIDKTRRAFTYDELAKLVKQAGLLRPSNVLRKFKSGICKRMPIGQRSSKTHHWLLCEACQSTWQRE